MTDTNQSATCFISARESQAQELKDIEMETPASPGWPSLGLIRAGHAGEDGAGELGGLVEGGDFVADFD